MSITFIPQGGSFQPMGFDAFPKSSLVMLSFIHISLCWVSDTCWSKRPSPSGLPSRAFVIYSSGARWASSGNGPRAVFPLLSVVSTIFPNSHTTYPSGNRIALDPALSFQCRRASQMSSGKLVRISCPPPYYAMSKPSSPLPATSLPMLPYSSLFV